MIRGACVQTRQPWINRPDKAIDEQPATAAKDRKRGGGEF